MSDKQTQDAMPAGARPEGFPAADSCTDSDRSAAASLKDTAGEEKAETVPAAGAGANDLGGTEAGPDSRSQSAEKEACPEDEAAPQSGEAADKPLSACARIFNALANVGPFILLVAMALLVWPDFWQAMHGKGFYCPAEGISITAFLHGAGSSLEPSGLANGAWQAQWPVFVWFLGLLAPLPLMAGLAQELVFPLASSIAALLAVWAVWGLARAAGFGKKAAFAAGIIVLCAPLFAPLPHFIGPGALAAALMMFSLIFFCRGWQARRAFASLPLAFILAGLAGLCGGLFHLALPLLASFFFLVWRGVRRASGKDALAGFILLLALLGAWLAAAILTGSDPAYLHGLFSTDTRFAWPLEKMWWLAPALAGVGLLPWILMVFGVSWIRVLAKSGQSLGASRHENGSALVWISLVLGLALSPFFERQAVVATALVCLAAPLLGKAFIRLPAIGNRFFFLLTSLCLVAAGVIQLCASFSATSDWLLASLPFALPAVFAQALQSLTALPVLGAICLLGGVFALAFVRGDHQGGGLIFSLVFTIILCQPAILLLSQELGANPAMGLATFADVNNSFKDFMAKASKQAGPEAGMRTLPAGTAPETKSQPADEQPAAPAIKPENGARPEEAAAEAAGPAEAEKDGAAEPESAPVPMVESAPSENPEQADGHAERPASEMMEEKDTGEDAKASGLEKRDLPDNADASLPETGKMPEAGLEGN